MATKRAFQRNLRDAELLVTRTLPAAASTTVNSTAIDTGVRTAQGSLEDRVEVVVKVPPLNATILPNTRTMTITVEQSDDSAFGSGVDVLNTLVLTGAGGVGIVPTSELRVPLGSNTKRYVRGKIVSGASTTDASAVTAEVALVF